MENRAETPPVTYARIAGAGYLVIIVSGIFAEFFVRQSLLVPGDAAATAGNILASASLYRWGMAGDLIMLLADVVVALALFFLFREVSKSLALLAAFLRLAQGAVLGANLLNVYVPLLLLGSGGRYLGAFDPEQLNALALLHLNAHAYGYAIGLVFFGVHCLVLGYLVLKSRYVPRILGALLLLAAFGYLIDSFARTLLSNYAAYENVLGMVVLIPAFVGELAFALWLLIRGVTVPAE
jgi:hypothetical protein